MELPSTNAPAMAKTDELAWLWEPRGERALAWAQENTARTLRALADDPRYQENYDAALSIFLDEHRVPGAAHPVPVVHDGWIYQIWRDDAHPRGLWRRAPLGSFRKGSPSWTVLLDIDELSRAEGKDYFVRMTSAHFGKRHMLALSEGGANRTVWREFDIEQRIFVKDGFTTPLSKANYLVWRDAHTVWVSTDFGPDALSRAGFPLVVKEWKRGQRLATAREIFRAPHETTLALGIGEIAGEDGVRHVLLVERRSDGSDVNFRVGPDGHPVRLSLPPRAIWYFGTLYKDQMLFSPLTDWTVGDTTWKSSSLLSIPMAEATRPVPTVRLAMEPPGDRESRGDVQVTRSGVLMYAMSNIRGQLWRLTYDEGVWTRHLVRLPDFGTIRPTIPSYSPDGPNFAIHESFLHPATLYEIEIAASRVVAVRHGQAHFGASCFEVEQLEVPSRDGTRVPYFVVRPKSLRLDGSAPTLLFGYGGFATPEYPTYDAVLGRLWLERGGVYVLANIRGGGEFGPAWHVTGANRQRTYDDFVAVAQDLVHRRITSPAKLGIEGHSAGGLLIGVMITQYPSLFGAAIPGVPVLDQLRLDMTFTGSERSRLEYGSLEVPEERAFLERTSPYQNLRKREGFPVPLFLTSTTDDTVPPGHARRFAAKMESLGMPFLYYESREGGHGLAATPRDKATVEALKFTYLARRLMDPAR